MSKDREAVACALDVGSSQIRAALGSFNKRDKIFEILSLETISPSRIKKGIVADMATCSQAIARVLKSVQAKAELNFDYLFLSLPSFQVAVEFAKGAYLAEKEKRIEKKDINHAVRSSVEFYLPLDRKLIETIVTEFSVDDQESILNPLGMFGKRVGVKTILLHSQVQLISNLITAVEESGYTIKEFIVPQLALADFTLSPHEKDTGTVLLDIGEMTTNISFFRNKFISEIKNFDKGIGGVARRTSSFFNIPYDYARQLSERYFSLSLGEEFSHQELLLERENEENKSILRKDFCLEGSQALKALFDDLERGLNKYPKNTNLVFLGGAALIEGFYEKLESLNFNVRIASPLPEKIKLSQTSFNNPIFLNCICACAYGFKMLNERRLNRLKNRLFLSRLIWQIKDLLEEYF